MKSPNEHASAALTLLSDLWGEVLESPDFAGCDKTLSQSIDAIFNGKEVGYKKAIVIQLVGKAADFSLDAQALQKGSGAAGAWDAREFGKRVFVPWNAGIGKPLGDADDPYVSNQFRNPRFDGSIREKRKSAAIFDITLQILERANAADAASEVVALLREVLFGLRRLIQGKSFEYPIPQRASIEATQNAIAKFLSVASGGGRMQAVAHALFQGLSHAGFEYVNLVARHVNASDAAGRSSGDVSFVKSGKSTAVEVKDRLLTSAQVSVSVTKARVGAVTELIFLVHDSRIDKIFTTEAEEKAAEQIAAKEFSSGLNVYWEPYMRLSRSILVVIGEQGRRDFLKFVGLALEEQSVDAQHRWAWAQIVAEI